jgi:hypothetical protein
LSTQTTVGIILKRLKWIKGKNENRDLYFHPEYKHQDQQEWEE